MKKRTAVRLRRLVLKLGFEQDWYLYLVATLIGLVMGYAAVAFILPLRAIEGFADSTTGSSHLWMLILGAPILGGIVTSILIALLKADGVGPGVTSAMYAVQRKKGMLPWRLGIRKWLASTATIGSGGSAGAEGPIVTIGAVVGSWVARVLGVGSQHTGTLLGCGAAAGIASVFNAPIAGIFFVMELLLRDFSLKTFTPIVIAAVVSSATTQGVLGDSVLFDVSDEYFHDGGNFSVYQLPVYLLLGLCCGAIGALFVKCLSFSERAFALTRLPVPMRPILGAIVLGIIGLTVFWLSSSKSVPAFYGNGYPAIKMILHPGTYYSGTGSELVSASTILWGLLGLAVIKLIATSVTVGSGGAGGLFAPSLLVGSATGGCVGYVIHLCGFFPETSPIYFALVGMAATVAATTHAPLTAILIVYEVTQSYELILPLMFAAVVSTVVSRFVCKESVYTYKLSQLGVRLGAMSDLTVLRRLTPSDVHIAKPVLVSSQESAQRLVELMESEGASDFVVTDTHQKYSGMVTSEDLRSALVYREAIPLLQVSELQRSDLPTIQMDEPLDLVLDKFSKKDVQSLTVVNNQDIILGVLTRAQLMKRYQKALDEDG